MNFSKPIRFFVILFLTGCSVSDRIAPISPTFLEGADVNHKIENLPFDQAWIKEGFDAKKYSKLLIKPIRTDLLTDWGKSKSVIITSKDDYDKEAKNIAQLFYEKLLTAIHEYDGNHIVVTENPGKDVLTMEIAFTELEFSHPITRATSLAVPLPGTGQIVDTITNPHAAFAARFTNSQDELVATVADRKFPPERIIDFNKLTATSSLREVVSIWSKIIAEALNKGQLKKTERSGRFSFLPW